MPSCHRRRPLHRSFAWLLWLAFVLPVAQVAAACHALSHVAVSAEGKQAPHEIHCDLCLAAAAVSGGALFAAPAVGLHHAATHEAPAAAVGGVAAVPVLRGYLSRAPPFARL